VETTLGETRLMAGIDITMGGATRGGCAHCLRRWRPVAPLGRSDCGPEDAGVRADDAAIAALPLVLEFTDEVLALYGS
jgi:hypothetical protein